MPSPRPSMLGRCVATLNMRIAVTPLGVMTQAGLLVFWCKKKACATTQSVHLLAASQRQQ